MKIRIVTEYDGITPEWYKWWLARFDKLPEYAKLNYSLAKYGTFTLDNSHEDELGKINGKTVYELIDNPATKGDGK